MAGDSAETSNKSNKSFYSTVFVLFFISKLYLKKFKQFSLGDLLKIFLFKKQRLKLICHLLEKNPKEVEVI